MEYSGLITHITIENGEEKKFIRETEEKFKAAMGNDYYITYDGGLS